MKNNYIIRLTGIFLLLLLVLAVVTVFTGCGNMQMLDTTYHYDRAIGILPDGTVIDGKVDSWLDYEDGDQLQIVVDGTSYLFHSSDVVLIAD